MRTKHHLAAVLVAAGAMAPHGAPARELPKVGIEQFASGFTSPVAMVPYQNGKQAFLVVDQTGVITFLGDEGGTPGGVFLDVRSRMVKLRKKFDERGLLGLALHPRFAENRKVYVYYSGPRRDDGPKEFDHTGRLAEYRVRDDHTADPASERTLLMVDEPQWNHNGGNLIFGPDGYLYLGLGDGGAAHDRAKGHEEGGNGQALNRLLGKILRIDVDSGDPYGIPPGNPLVGKDGRDEIFAWGIRNPWGITFDRGGSGEMIVADVGQNRFEEVDLVEIGKNYGWSRAEGLAEFSADNPGEVVKVDDTTAPAEFVAPILVYPHNEAYGKSPGYGISITGGHVYRGKAIPQLQGVYVFGDWGTSWATRKLGLFAGVPGPDGRWTMQLLPGATPPGKEDHRITAFAQDQAGEIYVLCNGSNGPDNPDGVIWKIVP